MEMNNANHPINPSVTHLKNLVSRYFPFVLGAFIIIGVGVYYWGTKKSQPPETPKTSHNQTRPSPTPTQQYEEPTTSVLESSFQDTLLENCKSISRPHTFFEVIDVHRAPVTINQNLINIKYHVPDMIGCTGYSMRSPNNYIVIELQDESEIYVYDKNSIEFGHGGPPYIGSYGTLIKDDGSIKITVYIGTNDSLPMASSARVIMRGEKRLKLSNGDIAYATYSLIAIEATDRRLVEFLDPYSKPSDNVPGDRELTRFPTIELKNKFFSNLAALQPSEREALSKIEQVLSAVSPK